MPFSRDRPHKRTLTKIKANLLKVAKVNKWFDCACSVAPYLLQFLGLRRASIMSSGFQVFASPRPTTFLCAPSQTIQIQLSEAHTHTCLSYGFASAHRHIHSQPHPAIARFHLSAQPIRHIHLFLSKNTAQSDITVMLCIFIYSSSFSTNQRRWDILTTIGKRRAQSRPCKPKLQDGHEEQIMGGNPRRWS